VDNWLNRSQAKELLAVPDRERLIGKRDPRSYPSCLAAGFAARSWRS
jgi:hypothetical protein